MKNVLLLLSIALLLLNGEASAQQILTQNGKDTAMASYTPGTDPYETFEVSNHIKSATSTPVYLRWNVVSSNFGTGWQLDSTGVCDNILCRTHDNATDPFITSGKSWKSDAYDNSGFSGSSHDFHVLFMPRNPPNGSSAYIRINARDTVSNTSRALTFIAYKGTLGINTLSSSDDIVLYPNPAREAVNVVYDPNAGVKMIAVYNLIGKMLGPVYKPSSAGSAKISLDDMPTGIYFLRLMDAQGRVLATRRFTRQ